MSACSSSGHATPDPIFNDYQRNISKWHQVDWQDYDVVYQRQCFCPVQLTKKIRIEVRAGLVISAVYDEDNGALDPNINYSLESIDGWFEVIDDAIRLSAHDIHASYDSTYGFPKSISIDYDPRIADDGVSVKIFDVIKR